MNLPLPLSSLSTPLPTVSPQFINLFSGQPSGHASSPTQELTEALCAADASINPKFFYDELGSRLFEAICGVREYYPTRTEASIFDASYAQIAAALAIAGIVRPCLIDLGAGNCAKGSALMRHLAPRQYVPVDISVDFLRESAAQVQNTFPALDIVGLGMDFSEDLTFPGEVDVQERVFFYPGSSLGNFHPAQALAFLQRIADPTQGRARGLLLGIDLVKDSATLEAAYDDALGVTAAFNKNMLLNVNSLIGSDFDVRQWRHVALFNVALSRIEMHLEACCDLTVRWTGHGRHFAAGERIHTESSYKYTLTTMEALLRQAGFKHVQHWTDAQNWFGVLWATV